jgi:MarR family transcriptional regulator for hemolysin
MRHKDAGLSASIGAIYELQASALEPRLRSLGLSWGSFQLLSAVYGSDRPSQAEIARRLGITQATLSETVAAHVARGLLSQEFDSADRRKRRLALTARGEELMANVARAVEDLDQRMADALSATERKQVGETLKKVIASLQELIE